MRTFLQPAMIMVLFVLVRAGDLAIGAAMGRDTIRVICYGFVAILALIAVIFVLFGIGV